MGVCTSDLQDPRPILQAPGQGPEPLPPPQGGWQWQDACCSQDRRFSRHAGIHVCRTGLGPAQPTCLSPTAITPASSSSFPTPSEVCWALQLDQPSPQATLLCWLIREHTCRVGGPDRAGATAEGRKPRAHGAGGHIPNRGSLLQDTGVWRGNHCFRAAPWLHNR